MTKFISLLALFISFSLFSQSYYQVNQTYFQQNNVSVNNNLGLYSIANSLRGFRNAWENENQKRRAINKYEAELNIIKKVYSEKEELPEKIVDGWHDVKVTDNYHYCSDAKVLVENNKIEIKLKQTDISDLDKLFQIQLEYEENELTVKSSRPKDKSAFEEKYTNLLIDLIVNSKTIITNNQIEALQNLKEKENQRLLT